MPPELVPSRYRLINAAHVRRCAGPRCACWHALRSPTRNWYNTVFADLTDATYTLYPTGGGTDILARSPSPALVTSPATNDQYGIILGGTAGLNQPDRRTMEAPFPNGNGAGLIFYTGATTVTVIQSSDNYGLVITRALQYGGPNTIAVREMGLLSLGPVNRYLLMYDPFATDIVLLSGVANLAQYVLQTRYQN